jgi:hypothetical protein
MLFRQWEKPVLQGARPDGSPSAALEAKMALGVIQECRLKPKAVARRARLS